MSAISTEHYAAIEYQYKTLVKLSKVRKLQDISTLKTDQMEIAIQDQSFTRGIDNSIKKRN